MKSSSYEIYGFTTLLQDYSSYRQDNSEALENTFSMSGKHVPKDHLSKESQPFRWSNPSAMCVMLRIESGCVNLGVFVVPAWQQDKKKIC